MFLSLSKLVKDVSKPNALEKNEATTTNLTSVIERLIIAYFLKDHEIEPEPNMNTYLIVILMSSQSHA